MVSVRDTIYYSTGNGFITQCLKDDDRHHCKGVIPVTRQMQNIDMHNIRYA